MDIVSKSKFNLGKLFVTRYAMAELSIKDIGKALARHLTGDWGDLCDDDKKLNDEALENGGRLFSVYHSSKGTKFYVITEADRSLTTVLLPDEY